MQYDYTIKYYPAVNKKETMKSSGKWMRLEAIILSEVTQTRNTVCRVFSDSLDVCVSSGMSTEARKLELHGSLLL